MFINANKIILRTFDIYGLTILQFVEVYRLVVKMLVIGEDKLKVFDNLKKGEQNFLKFFESGQIINTVCELLLIFW